MLASFTPLSCSVQALYDYYHAQPEDEILCIERSVHGEKQLTLSKRLSFLGAVGKALHIRGRSQKYYSDKSLKKFIVNRLIKNEELLCIFDRVFEGTLNAEDAFGLDASAARRSAGILASYELAYLGSVELQKRYGRVFQVVMHVKHNEYRSSYGVHSGPHMRKETWKKHVWLIEEALGEPIRGQHEFIKEAFSEKTQFNDSVSLNEGWTLMPWRLLSNGVIHIDAYHYLHCGKC